MLYLKRAGVTTYAEYYTFVIESVLKYGLPEIFN